MSNTTSLFQLKTYQDAVQFVDSLDISVQKLGLSRIQQLLNTLNNPQDQIVTVHVAGTNGKGSTVALLSSILKESGYKTGSFISPHLHHVRERIAINGNPILPEDFLQLTRYLKEVLEKTTPDKDSWPTYFEFMTALGFLYFKQQGVDIAIIEVGLGGRLDSTNIIKHPNLAIITSIGLDHTAHLGNTIEAITKEKAGIIKEDSPIVIGSKVPQAATAIINAIAQQNNAAVSIADDIYLTIGPESGLENGLIIKDQQHQLTYQLPLVGQYSVSNLATTLKAVEVLRNQQFTISNEALQQGISKTHWPARFEYIASKHLILDGSHNRDGLEALSLDIKTYFDKKPLYWLVSLKAAKEADALTQCIAQFDTQNQGVIFTGNPDEHYHDPEKLKQQLQQTMLVNNLPITSDVDPSKAFIQLQQHLDKNPEAIGIITGSLYTAGLLRDQIDA